MPSTSKDQQTAARIALAVKHGKVKPKPGSASAKMAQMPEKSLRHYTKLKKGK